MNGNAENIFASELNKFGKTFTLPVDNRRCEVKGHTNVAQGLRDTRTWRDGASGVVTLVIVEVKGLNAAAAVRSDV